MPTINHELIILARETMGMTQANLADELKIKQSTISKIEHGILPFPEILLPKLSNTTNYPETFFYQEWKPLRIEGHYRRKITLSVKSLKECVAKMTLAEKHFSTLSESVEIPELNYPTWDVEIDGSPTLCAKHLREFWKIPKGRIENLSDLIEDNGIPIIEIDLGEMDGFTTVSKVGVPIIFINRNRSGDRDLYTKAHELFHIIAHFGQKVSQERDVDKEANEFASEFLLPEKDIRQDLVKLSIPKLATLKKYWKVSMASMIMKAKKLSLLSQDQYEYLWKQMSSLGYRTKEPVETPKEVATLFQEMINTYQQELAYSSEELQQILHFPASKIDEWYFNKKVNRLKIVRKTA